jgi:hypothetical protein
MAEPQTNSNESKSQVVFSTKKVFEIYKTRSYDEFLRKWYTTVKASINGTDYYISNEEYDEILRILRKKIQVLRYIHDENAQKSLIEDIMVEIAKLIFKLEAGDTV